MAVLATFDPGNDSYGRSANALFSGMNQGLSMMERKQNMALQQQRADQQRMEFIAKLPVLQAAAQADIASAHASVENAALMEQFRGKAASESKALNEEYLAAISLPNFEDQSRALSALQPRIAYMDVLPEYKGFVLAVNNATVRAHGSAQVDRQLNNKLEGIDLKNQANVEVQNAKAELAKTLAEERNKSMQEKMTLMAERDQAKREATGNVEYSKERGKAQAALVADVQGRVQQHYATLDQTARARSLIDQDAEQGRGVSTVLGVQQAINSFLPGTFDTSKQETLKQSYAEMALAAAAKMKGQGSITENERALLADSVAKFGNSPQAAKYIMDFMDAVAKREIARAEYYSELEDDGQMVTGKRTTDFYKGNPISKFINSGIPQTTPAGGKGGEPQVPLKVLGFEKVGG